MRLTDRLPRRCRARVALLALVLAAAGFLYAWLGLAPIDASAGHWAVTRWVLGFSMRNAVETRALGITVPPLDDAGLVLKGAGHYATGCAPCHGAPGQKPSFVVEHMTPEAPFLPPAVADWAPAELFWIVRNGIKFTAMPAWPAPQREDEVWAMVAFLLQLPRMEPQVYRDLAWGEQPAQERARLRDLSRPPGPLLADCARCHGEDGMGRGEGAVPRLAGQRFEYLAASLHAYAEGARHSGIMQVVATGLGKEAIAELARHYADEPAQPLRLEGLDAAAVKRGERIARRGVPEQGIPSCVHCHGPGHAPRNPHYPQLAGQYPDYLALQLRLFRTERRGGTPYLHLMTTTAHRLNDEQIRDVTHYYGSLPPAEGEAR